MRMVRKSIGQAVGEVAQAQAERDALVHTELGVRYSYGRLWAETERVAGGLIRLGIGKGDRVALWAPNIPEWLLSFIALSRIGAISVPVDPGVDMDTLRYMMNQTACKAVILSHDVHQGTGIEMATRIMEETGVLQNLIVVAGSPPPATIPWNDLVARGPSPGPTDLRPLERVLKPEDPVSIMYTSGTTGQPKGVVLDHLGLVNKSFHATERQGLNAEDRSALFFPLFHMFGNTCIALSGLLRGAALVMCCKAFDPARVLQSLREEPCTAVFGSPSMLISLLDHPDFDPASWQGIKKGILGGAPCPMGLMKRLVQDIGVSHVTVAYGITEASSWITMTNPDDPLDLRVATIGTALSCNEVRIVDPKTGERLPPDTQGELCTRGFLMREYYGMPGATAAAIDRGGWFHTGDLGEMDPRGYVRITGRLKDVVERSGEAIYPVELEEIIYKRPEVSEVQVFGFPHPEKGQEVAAWVKLKDGQSLSRARLARHVLAACPVEKAPGHYKFVDDFPMTRSGKVQKYKLAEWAEEEYAEG